MMTKTEMTAMYSLFGRGIERMEELIEDHRQQSDNDTLELLKGWLEELEEYAQAFPEIAEDCANAIDSAQELIAREIDHEPRAESYGV